MHRIPPDIIRNRAIFSLRNHKHPPICCRLIWVKDQNKRRAYLHHRLYENECKWILKGSLYCEQRRKPLTDKKLNLKKRTWPDLEGLPTGPTPLLGHGLASVEQKMWTFYGSRCSLCCFQATNKRQVGVQLIGMSRSQQQYLLSVLRRTLSHPHHPLCTSATASNTHSRLLWFLHTKLLHPSRWQSMMPGSRQHRVLQPGRRYSATLHPRTRLHVLPGRLTGRRRVVDHVLAATSVRLPGVRGAFLAATSYLVTSAYTQVCDRSRASSAGGRSVAPTTYELTCARIVANGRLSAMCAVEHSHAATNETVTWQFIPVTGLAVRVAIATHRDHTVVVSHSHADQIVKDLRYCNAEQKRNESRVTKQQSKETFSFRTFPVYFAADANIYLVVRQSCLLAVAIRLLHCCT